ncbi:hypothetical protein J6590_030460 [Homalodisca vitripennis]|nr:hypothetical protein J6590_030460 [Homalodisca vitripennis]
MRTSADGERSKTLDFESELDIAQKQQMRRWQTPSVTALPSSEVIHYDLPRAPSQAILAHRGSGVAQPGPCGGH